MIQHGSYDVDDHEDETQAVLDAIAGRRPNFKGVVRANCPFCPTASGKVDRKQCLSVNVTSGFWKCYRCGNEARIPSDQMPYDVSSLKVEKPTEAKPPMNLPEGFVHLWRPEGQAIACRPAWKYLKEIRKPPVSDEIIEAARVGCCIRGRYAGRIVVPIYRAGKLAGFMTRVWKKKHERAYLYGPGLERAITLYNEEALYLTTREPVIIVEGIFDTFPFWPNAVAVLGKPSEPQVEMMRAARRPLLVVFDGDAHREATALAMMLRMAGKEAAALKLPPGVDPDEVHEHVKQRAKAAFAA